MIIPFWGCLLLRGASINSYILKLFKYIYKFLYIILSHLFYYDEKSYKCSSFYPFAILLANESYNNKGQIYKDKFTDILENNSDIVLNSKSIWVVFLVSFCLLILTIFTIFSIYSSLATIKLFIENILHHKFMIYILKNKKWFYLFFFTFYIILLHFVITNLYRLYIFIDRIIKYNFYNYKELINISPLLIVTIVFYSNIIIWLNIYNKKKETEHYSKVYITIAIFLFIMLIFWISVLLGYNYQYNSFYMLILTFILSICNKINILFHLDFINLKIFWFKCRIPMYWFKHINLHRISGGVGAIIGKVDNSIYDLNVDSNIDNRTRQGIEYNKRKSPEELENNIVKKQKQSHSNKKIRHFTLDEYKINFLRSRNVDPFPVAPWIEDRNNPYYWYVNSKWHTNQTFFYDKRCHIIYRDRWNFVPYSVRLYHPFFKQSMAMHIDEYIPHTQTHSWLNEMFIFEIGKDIKLIKYLLVSLANDIYTRTQIVDWDCKPHNYEMVKWNALLDQRRLFSCPVYNEETDVFEKKIFNFNRKGQGGHIPLYYSICMKLEASLLLLEQGKLKLCNDLDLKSRKVYNKDINEYLEVLNSKLQYITLKESVENAKNDVKELRYRKDDFFGLYNGFNSQTEAYTNKLLYEIITDINNLKMELINEINEQRTNGKLQEKENLINTLSSLSDHLCIILKEKYHTHLSHMFKEANVNCIPSTKKLDLLLNMNSNDKNVKTIIQHINKKHPNLKSVFEPNNIDLELLD